MSIEPLDRAPKAATRSIVTPEDLNVGPIARAKPESVGLSSERLRRVGEVIGRYIDTGVLTGATTMLARRGKLAHFETHGLSDLEAGTPTSADAVYRMASSTKPIAGVAVLMMMEEGRVRLLDPVRAYIPEFVNTMVAVRRGDRTDEPRRPGDPLPDYDLVPAHREITVRDLMTHTSGLLSGGLGAAINDVERQRGDTLASYIPRLGAVALDFQPGTKWRYSGGAGIDTLGRIVEIASGQSFDRFLQERIFDPLGMKDSAFGVTGDRLERLLPLYRRVDDAWVRTPQPASSAPVTYFSGAGGLTSTARDYLLFQEMLSNKGELNGERLLGSRTVELMASNHVGDIYHGVSGARGGHGFGLTVHVTLDHVHGNTGRSNGAFGWGGAFGTLTWSDPAERISGVIMLQQRVEQVQFDVERAFRQAIID